MAQSLPAWAAPPPHPSVVEPSLLFICTAILFVLCHQGHLWAQCLYGYTMLAAFFPFTFP